MATDPPTEYFREHSALADWLRAVSPAERDSILAEDSARSHRLKRLKETIDLPIISAVTFPGSATDPPSTQFAEFVAVAQGRYALRAFKVGDRDQVFRNRNLPIHQLLTWLDGLELNLADYELEFSQHLPNEWATIFVVNESGVLGEFVQGSLRQLTQGGQTAGPSIGFTYDFTDWRVDSSDRRWLERAKALIRHVTVPDGRTRETLVDEFGCRFAAETVLQGYFEAIGAPDNDIRFIDFNITLGRQFDGWYVGSPTGPDSAAAGALTGRIASRGRTTAVARVIFDDRALPTLVGGEVLVCIEPTPDMVALLPKAGGLVADRGGVLSHASIVCRELGIPCVVATHNATEVIEDGASVTVDADAGSITIHLAQR